MKKLIIINNINNKIYVLKIIKAFAKKKYASKYHKIQNQFLFKNKLPNKNFLDFYKILRKYSKAFSKFVK